MSLLLIRTEATSKINQVFRIRLERVSIDQSQLLSEALNHRGVKSKRD